MPLINFEMVMIENIEESIKFLLIVNHNLK